MVSLVTELLFSYGTLRQPGVQRDVLGRELDGRPDAIVGYDLDYAAIEGTVYAVTEDDLVAADDYEVDYCERIAVPLRSGDHAWVYVFADKRITTD
ncbi:MAG: gamma-glutamylcyclotransferase family protein [Mycobacterium sp.]